MLAEAEALLSERKHNLRATDTTTPAFLFGAKVVRDFGAELIGNSTGKALAKLFQLLLPVYLLASAKPRFWEDEGFWGGLGVFVLVCFAGLMFSILARSGSREARSSMQWRTLLPERIARLEDAIRRWKEVDANDDSDPKERNAVLRRLEQTVASEKIIPRAP